MITAHELNYFLIPITLMVTLFTFLHFFASPHIPHLSVKAHALKSKSCIICDFAKPVQIEPWWQSMPFCI